MSLITKFLDALYPKNYVCLSCGCEIECNDIALCDKCKNSLPQLNKHRCNKCDATTNEDTHICDLCKSTPMVFDKNYSAFDYSGSIKKMLLGLKYHGAKYNGSTLSYLLYEKYLTINHNFDLIIPVPLSAERLSERKYNQVEVLLEKFILEKCNVVSDVLVRTIDTPHQASLSRRDRLTNLKGAFTITNKRVVKGKDVLLVDDVFTTGATVNECASTLFKAGAKSVTVLTLCRNNNKENADDKKHR